VLVGAAIIPTAPVLVPGVSGTPPAGIAKVADAVEACLERFADHDLVVLLGVGQTGGVYDRACADLAPIGRPDIADEAPVAAETAEQIMARTGYGRCRGDPLPLSLTVLLLLVGTSRPVLPLAVPPTAGFDALAAVGTGIAEAISVQGRRAVVVAAGDLSAGLTERSPLHRIAGARDWDDRVRDVVDSGRLDGLARLGPAEARRVGALGWCPLAVLHGCVARAKVGMVLRHYSAPRGVGYLVAHGA
jgi:hypothetical protein